MLSVVNRALLLSVIKLNVIMLSVVMLSAVMLSVIMLGVIMLSVVMLSAGAPTSITFDQFFCYPQCPLFMNIVHTSGKKDIDHFSNKHLQTCLEQLLFVLIILFAFFYKMSYPMMHSLIGNSNNVMKRKIPVLNEMK